MRLAHEEGLQPGNRPLPTTDRIEAEKKREELIRERSKADSYGFALSFGLDPFIFIHPIPKLRNAIIKNFADRF